VFDGHGGKQVSEHCAECMALEFKKEIVKKPKDLYQTFE
jgi:serine/threonine protein phosphatase PrpC